MIQRERVVITGVGLTAPNGNNLAEYRMALLERRSGIVMTDVRHMGRYPAGLCSFDEQKYQTKKARKRGTRAGSVAIYCAREALADAGLALEQLDRARCGIYIGITEHGNVETENEIHDLYQNNLDVSFWSHYHNPRTVANNPAGEVSVHCGITGPHYTLGGACAAGNLGIIQAVQQLQLGEVDVALGGGVSESTGTFGIFASFQNEGALGAHPEDPRLATRPLHRERNGIVVSEGGCLFVLERLSDALQRGAKIYGEVVGYAVNSDAIDFVLPNAGRQIECMQLALKRAGLTPDQIDLVNLHATGTLSGDVIECEAVGALFAQSPRTHVNGTKGMIGHTMGASGALELAGNLPSLQEDDGLIHTFGALRRDELDPRCSLPRLVLEENVHYSTKTILNNSFGMLGINSCVIVQKYN